MPLQSSSVIILVLARPVPISRLAVRWAASITSVPLQPHCALVAGVHEEVVVAVIAASRYVHVVAGVALRSSPQVNGMGAT